MAQTVAIVGRMLPGSVCPACSRHRCHAAPSFTTATTPWPPLPQLRHLPASQVAASVRLGLRPRLHRPGLPPPPLGAATVNAYGALALQLAQHVHKGSRLQVRGTGGRALSQRMPCL